MNIPETGNAPLWVQTLTVTTADQTHALGAAMAEVLRAGDLVVLTGELGAGKTTFVRGALRGLGVQGPVTSPTFVVGHLHDGRDGPLAHLDLYRLAGMGGEDPGLLDPFFAEDTIAFVEWPEHAEDAWPSGRVSHRVRLAHAGGDQRRIEIA